MISKPKLNKRKFVPLRISDSLSDVNRKFLYKFGKLDYTIHAKWGEIVGKFFVNHTEPSKITSILISTSENGENFYEKFLHVNVEPAAALEFQYFQDKIIEKINSYFGYKAIKGIKIHQHHQKTSFNHKKVNNLSLIEQKRNEIDIRNKTPKLSNKELEESIVKLGLSIKKEK